MSDSPADYPDSDGEASYRYPPVSDDGSVLLTQIGVRTIELYQKQSAAMGRQWSIYLVNSLVAILLAICIPIAARNNLAFRPGPMEIVPNAISIIAYAIFSIASGRGIYEAQDVLRQIAAQASLATNLRIKPALPARVRLFQMIMSALVIYIMVLGLFGDYFSVR